MNNSLLNLWISDKINKNIKQFYNTYKSKYSQLEGMKSNSHLFRTLL